MAYCRHISLTVQRAHTAFAFSIWSTAGPVFPTGKNSSGSTVRQAALSRQSMVMLLVACESASAGVPVGSGTLCELRAERSPHAAVGAHGHRQSFHGFRGIGKRSAPLSGIDC